MKRFFSSRNKDYSVSAPEAVIRGLSPDGGLYTPKYMMECALPLESLRNLSYASLAERIMGAVFSDYTQEELSKVIHAAYDTNFSTPEVTPVSSLGNDGLLELYHGPTSAFKDVALTLLPHLLTTSYAKCGEDKQVLILTATSGDTGKAALEGFKDVENTHIIVFYPSEGVSRTQQLQMQTTGGSNTRVVAVQGDFDDCQRLVKSCYQDERVQEACGNKVVLSSANSINIGRLVPQIVYYFKAYFDMVNEGKVEFGKPVHFVVPTGNFGDILAGHYAKALGCPVGKLICASNANRVLTDFLQTGTYDRRRTFYKTTSPSMDILVSSNLERMLFEASGYDGDLIRSYLQQLNEEGHYSVTPEILAVMQSEYEGYCAGEDRVSETIAEVYKEYKKLIDPHTAVAVDAMKQFRKAHPEDKTPCVVLSTASPYKFSRAVLQSLSDDVPEDDFSCMMKLKELTGAPVPENLSCLKDLPIRHDMVIRQEDGIDTVVNYIREVCRV
ncbi:MAG: threonine synthase [Lachnospiraceae bacterium]